MTLIVRVYASEKKARDAAQKLKSEGIGNGAAMVMSPKPDADAAAEVAAAVKSGQVPAPLRSMATENLKQGRSIVMIDPPFGYGAPATEILDSFGPLEVAVPAVTPMGTVSQFTTEGWGLPLLWNGKSIFANFFGGELTSAKPRATLSNDAAPLSSRFGMRVLTEPKKDWTQSFGQKLLSSKRFITGEPKLTSEAAPLSSRIGMKTLTEPKKEWTTDSFGQPLLSSNPTPLSDMMGWRVLISK